MRSFDFIEELAIETEHDVLPLWPSARAFVEALIERPEWLEDVAAIIDMGCGSGIIGIAASCLSRAESCLFVDINVAAVELALRNASRNKVCAEGKVSDTWSNVGTLAVDLIICNPPFQPYGDGGRNLVDPGFRMHEALFAGAGDRLSSTGRLLVATAPAISGGRQPQAIAAKHGWAIQDACTISAAAPSPRHPDRVHDYTMLLLRR